MEKKITIVTFPVANEIHAERHTFDDLSMEETIAKLNKISNVDFFEWGDNLIDAIDDCELLNDWDNDFPSYFSTNEEYLETKNRWSEIFNMDDFENYIHNRWAFAIDKPLSEIEYKK